MLNLDTHILIFALQNQVSAGERTVLSKHRWGISAVVLWEIAKLHQKKRINLGLDSPVLMEALSKVEIWPITREICLNVLSLDFSSDPADELIAATSLTHNIPLLTRDCRVRSSKLLKFAC
jgi:PIN domain nuclease of toxin-antitoxin system